MAKPTGDQHKERIYLKPSEMIEVLKGIIIHNYMNAQNCHLNGTTPSDASYIVPMIWGSPGIGKTRVVHLAVRMANEFLAKKYHSFTPMPVIVEPIADKSPEEIAGYPRPDSDLTFRRLMPHKWWKENNTPIVGFFDEIAQGNVEQQNVARGALLGHTIGELTFKPGSTVIAASNLMEDRAGTHVMPTHVRDVLTHLYMMPDHREWAMWGAEMGIAFEITSFIQVHGAQFLHQLETQSTALACPSPRSWEKAHHIYSSDAPIHLKKAMISGTVGNAACGALFDHIRVGKYMPDTKAILAGQAVKMDESKTDVMYMTMCALAGEVSEISAKNLVKWLKTIKHKEFGSFCVNMSLRREPKLRSKMSEWLLDNEVDLIL